MNYYNEIKNELINNEITKRVKYYSINKSDLNTYYNVGKLLADAGKHYGEGIIKNYSKRLTEELGKGYTQTRLKYYRRFFNVFSKCPTLSDELSYSHYCEIIWYDELKMNYYINLSINQKPSTYLDEISGPRRFAFNFFFLAICLSMWDLKFPNQGWNLSLLQ